MNPLLAPLLACALLAASTPPQDDDGQPLSPCAAENTAFLPGEDLLYDLYFQWKFIWVKAGTAHYHVSQTPDGHLRTDLLFAGSKRLNAVFPMKDTLVSEATADLTPLYFRKGATEGKHYTVDEVFYTYPQGRSHVQQRFLNRHGQWSEHTHESAECNYDMLSILNAARSFDASAYEQGHRIHFPMATGKRVEEQTLVYKGLKDFKANDGNTYRCLVFSLLDYDTKDREKELLRFYVTDDANHLPVRIDFYLRFGIAKAYYQGGTGIRHPQEAIVPKK